MKKYILLLTFSMLVVNVFLFISPTKATDSDIIITEICPTGCASSGHQWIEIFNQGTEAINLENWRFWEQGTNHSLKISSSSLETDWLIEPNEYAIIAQNDEYFFADHPEVTTTIFDSSWGTLNKSGEEIGLKKGTTENDFIEKFVYSVVVRYSLERDSTGQWLENLSGNTAGRENSNFSFSEPAPTPPTPDPVEIIEIIETPTPEPAPTTFSTPTPELITPVTPESAPPRIYNTTGVDINEFVSDPLTGQKEWIELYNYSDAEINLADFILSDGAGKIATIDSPISSHGYLVITLTSSKLNNSGDIITLTNPDGIILNQITYGNWDDGNLDDNAPSVSDPNSVARDDNNVFVESEKPTPGAQNQGFLIPIAELEDEPVDDFVLPITAPLFSFSNPITIILQPSSTTTKSASVSSTSTKTTVKQPTKIATTKKSSTQTSVTGFVTVEPGILGSQYFYIINEDGCGGQIYQYKKDFPDLKLGDRITAVGEISQINGETRIKIKQKTDIQIIDSGTVPEPLFVNSTDLNTDFIGCLIKLTGEITEIKSSYLYLDDSSGEAKIYFKTNANIDSGEYKIGNTAEITGIVAGTKDGFQILPRSAEDIVLITEETTSTATSTQAITSENQSSSTAKKYLFATAGGFTSILIGLGIKMRGSWLVRLLKKK